MKDKYTSTEQILLDVESMPHDELLYIFKYIAIRYFDQRGVADFTFRHYYDKAKDTSKRRKKTDGKNN